MPFTIMMENWRYAVFNGTFTEDQWMEKFWEMKNEWVGVKAPAERTEKCESDYYLIKIGLKFRVNELRPGPLKFPTHSF